MADFFADLPEDEKEKPVVVEEEKEVVEEKPAERSAEQIALERKSTALAEERRKRKALEARVAELEGKKKEEPEEKEEEVEEKKPETIDRDSIVKEVIEKQKQDDYSSKTVARIGFIAKGAGKTKQWAMKVKETVDTLPQNLRSGDAETDTQTAIRFLESSSSGGTSFNLPSGGGAFDLPSANSGDERLSASGRELARGKMNMTDEQIDKYMKEPQIKMQDGSIGFKLIK